MSTIQDYSQEEIVAVRNAMGAAEIERLRGRPLDDQELLGFVDTFVGQSAVLRVRVRNLINAIKWAWGKRRDRE